MYNRYQGNTGRFVRLPEPFEGGGQRAGAAEDAGPNPPPADTHAGPKAAPPRPPEAPGRRAAPRPPKGGGHMPAPPGREDPLGKLLGGFGGALSGRLSNLNTEDLLLLAVVYLMYRENGDKQLLVVLAALLLL